VWQYAFWSALGGVALLIASGIYTWDFFHTSYQQQLLNVVDTVDVKKDTKGATAVFSPIPVEEMCTVSPGVAERVILTKMGDLKNTYYVGSLTKQSFSGHFTAKTFDGNEVRIDYDNHLVYVGILEHKGFWTWKAQPWSPAYVLVDATDKDKSYVITEVNNEPIKLVYTPDANFSCNLERHLRFNGYTSVILDDFNVELDENGRPYAPVTTMEHKVGLSTPDVTGVAVVDVQTGDIKWYAPQDAPAFVNRIYPEDMVYDRLFTWGDYKNGYIHWSNNEGLLQACKGMDIVQTKKGCHYYVGIQAQTATFDTEGYMLINIRTGEATYYRRDGISEEEAVRVLKTVTYKGKDGDRDLSLSLTNEVLYLTEPIYYNIEGMNTYFATFIANADKTVKYYAFCSADSKDVVGVGENLEEAKAAYIESYHKNMAVKSQKFQTADKRLEVTIEAEVLEKVREGSAYYFRLSGQEGKTFYTYSGIIPEVRWDAKKVKISFNKTDAKVIAISSYEKVE
ncbi:MAG: hypothetical protein IJ677_00685, partial [Alphaproteobacteria bacterium]|nr:hypothetical protein [Alphaproteobacteria bacterium]